VAPREVDDALLAHPDVKYAVAFAIPHPRQGEEVGAAVVLHDGAHATAAGLRVFVADRLAPYKVPRRVVAIDEIPRGATGKLDRAGLADRLGLVSHAAHAGVRVPPADDLERRVAHAWRAVLGDDELPSVDADFFALGGDSLHAVELLEVIERELGRRLPATVFFEGATVRSMADRLRADPADPQRSFVVPVQPRGSGLPLFCLMRAGSVVTLRHLAATLGPEQPVYGLWMPSMHGPDPATGAIEDLAATALALVREVRPHGPYALFGHSLGAVVVYELARQLAAAGDTVAFIGMADAIHPDLIRERWARRHSTRYRLRKLLSTKGPAVVAWRVRHVLGRNPPPPVRYLPGTDAVVDWAAALARERGYHPGPPPIPIVLYATRQYSEHTGTADLGWARVVPPASEYVEVPGDHDSMIGEPHVHVLAARLAEDLDRAVARAGGGGLSPGGADA
jgi:thioesterase domain-containing protein/acyl carrier protein